MVLGLLDFLEVGGQILVVAEELVRRESIDVADPIEPPQGLEAALFEEELGGLLEIGHRENEHEQAGDEAEEDDDDPPLLDEVEQDADQDPGDSERRLQGRRVLLAEVEVHGFSQIGDADPDRGLAPGSCEKQADVRHAHAPAEAEDRDAASCDGPRQNQGRLPAIVVGEEQEY